MVGGGWVLDFTRLMLISTQVEAVLEVEVFVNIGSMKTGIWPFKAIFSHLLLKNGHLVAKGFQKKSSGTKAFNQKKPPAKRPTQIKRLVAFSHTHLTDLS